MAKRGNFKVFLLLAFFITSSFFSVYSFNENQEKLGGEVGFDNVPDSFEITVGESFYYDFDMGNGYYFTDDTDNFEIGKNDGVINFIPEKNGEFDVVIIAMKDSENFFYKSIHFKVVE